MPSTASPGRSVASVPSEGTAASTAGGRGPPCYGERREALIWDHRPDGLRAPALVCAFTGWNDAGDAASSALSFVGASLGASRFAQIDPEDFYDFQTVRPKVRLVDGETREIVWPAVEVFAARV